MVQHKHRDEPVDDLWLVKVETPNTVHAAPDPSGFETLCGRDISANGTKQVENLGPVEDLVFVECRHCYREAAYLFG